MAKSYTTSEKCAIVRYAKKQGKRAASRKFGCSEQAIYNWINSDKFEQYGIVAAAEDCKKIQAIVDTIPLTARELIRDNIVW